MEESQQARMLRYGNPEIIDQCNVGQNTYL